MNWFAKLKDFGNEILYLWFKQTVMAKNTNILIGIALGVAAGAVAAYLLSNDETKEKIKKAAVDASDTLKDEFDKFRKTSANAGSKAEASSPKA